MSANALLSSHFYVPNDIYENQLFIMTPFSLLASTLEANTSEEAPIIRDFYETCYLSIFSSTHFTSSTDT